MNFINNPFDILIEIMKENYPSIECDIVIGQDLTDGKEMYGCTLFPDDEEVNPLIEIHHSLNLNDATEILAHELAHVIAGKDAEHNEEWERVFDELCNQFHKKVDERFTNMGAHLRRINNGM